MAVYRYPMPYTARRAIGYALEYPWALLFTFIYACYVFARRGFHVIHACNPPDLFFLAALPFKLFGVKFLFDQHDLCPETYLSKFEGDGGVVLKALRFLERCTYKTANAVIATNESYKQVAIERGGIEPERVWVVRSAPDLRRFVPMPPKPALRKGKRFLVAYLGTMGQQDGVELPAAQRAPHRRLAAQGYSLPSDGRGRKPGVSETDGDGVEARRDRGVYGSGLERRGLRRRCRRRICAWRRIRSAR